MWKQLTVRRFTAITLLGFASGLPLALTSFSLQAWYTVAGIDIITIGFLGLLGIPYTFKFLWAPLVDRFHIPIFAGRRRGWILTMQIGLAVGLVVMGLLNPVTHTHLLALVAFAVALLSATQDIAFDAYRTEVVSENERGLAAALGVTGYRLAVIVSGGLAYILADKIGWQWTYFIMAGVMLLSVIGTFLGPEKPNIEQAPGTLQQAIIGPFCEFMRRDKAVAILLFIVLYKLGDAFINTLTPTFLLRGLGFTLTEVGLATKVIGLLATIFGVLLGGILLARLNIYRALLIFGVLQAMSIVVFLLLAIVGRHYGLMLVAVFAENFCAGLLTAAFVAFLMSLCHSAYTAAQFALFSALAAVGRVFIGPLAGVVAENFGWITFYWWAFVICLPGLVLLGWMRPRLQVDAPMVS